MHNYLVPWLNAIFLILISLKCPPRNIAEKINNGYKAWEFLLYMYGLGPELLFERLPNVHWVHFCHLVRGIWLLLQEEIAIDDLKEAEYVVSKFSDGFEELYVQCWMGQIHFVWACIHTISHLAPETIWVGPNIVDSQWSMEWAIRNLGKEIQQHSNPFANLAQCGLWCCQVNVIKAMILDFCPPENVPWCDRYWWWLCHNSLKFIFSCSWQCLIQAFQLLSVHVWGKPKFFSRGESHRWFDLSEEEKAVSI